MTKQTEHSIQASCVRWFRLQYPKLLLVSIPNGAKLYGAAKTRAQLWRKFEREGAIPGAADLLLATPSADLGGLFIEIKTPQGKQSDRQKLFEKMALESGFGYAIARSFDEFRAVVVEYLKSGNY